MITTNVDNETKKAALSPREGRNLICTQPEKSETMKPVRKPLTTTGEQSRFFSVKVQDGKYASSVANKMGALMFDGILVKISYPAAVAGTSIVRCMEKDNNSSHFNPVDMTVTSMRFFKDGLPRNEISKLCSFVKVESVKLTHFQGDPWSDTV